MFDLNDIQIERLLVKDIMSTSAVTVNKGDTLAEVLARMKKDRLREVPVLDGDRPMGLVSYSSFLTRRSLPLSSKVEQVMLPCPRLEEDMMLTNAVEEMMSAGVRGAPVVRAHKMVGFVSRTDVIRILPQVAQLKDKEVSSFMSTNPVSVTEAETIRHAQILMKGLNEKALPVVDSSKRLIGVIGMREIMDVFWTSKKAAKTPNEIMGNRNPPDINVGSIMNRPAVAVTPKDTIGRIASIMLDKHLSTVFVQEDGRLVGVVSQADLMEQVVGLKPREGVFVQLTGLDEEDPDVYDVLYGLIEKSMKRIDKIQSPKIFTVHVTIYHHEGLRSKYSLHARLTTEKSLYYASGTDWSLYKTLDAVLEQLEKSVKKESEKQRDQRRSKQPSQVPVLRS